MWRYWTAAAWVFVMVWALEVQGEETNLGGLLHLSEKSLLSALPENTRLLLETSAIERFLIELDGNPPDWAAVYGGGHHDPGHDAQLFALNRERDAKREGKPALSWIITFAWAGALSPYDDETGGFSVALGPKFMTTRWGIVRFKPEEVPGNLVVVAGAGQREVLQRAIEEQRRLDIEVVMTGQLIPEESLVYDFSHEEEGRGLIMPVVRIQRVDFLLAGQE
jgi:hypothetical protein